MAAIEAAHSAQIVYKEEGVPKKMLVGNIG
jgi:hypothetical protein